MRLSQAIAWSAGFSGGYFLYQAFCAVPDYAHAASSSFTSAFTVWTIYVFLKFGQEKKHG